MNGTFNKRYVVTLAVLATAVLALGALFRPGRSTPEPPSPSETASLRTKLGEYVTFNSEHATSAVAWEKAGQVITTSTPESPAFDAPLLIAKTRLARVIITLAESLLAGLIVASGMLFVGQPWTISILLGAISMEKAAASTLMVM